MKRQTQLTTETEDTLKGRQLTEQYHRATGGMKEVVIFGAMMMQLRAQYPDMTRPGGDRRPLSKRGQCSGPEPVTLSKWLETHAPEVKRTTALRFLHVTEAITDQYPLIVGASLAKRISLPDLVTTPPEELNKQAAAKQLELFEWVNGTSQRSWLDRFHPDSAQKRGAATRAEQGPPRKLTPEESAANLKRRAEEEITVILNSLDAWFTIAHHTRIDAPLRLTVEAVLEEAIKKIRAVK